ncbi:DUF305 domain-containing protein [Polymorphospora rubra]|uniref:DUF305 domain-containing protein n=1 Tax=Polymorphospora rubra TaxID=338584 RepID=A0A810NBE0_9ACTN|nr:DUF305 domain-containing protein [Polymorphospora rubra]BCJ68863.1 DUF305 domain-containing protein [Polymorphospora rubra]
MYAFARGTAAVAALLLLAGCAGTPAGTARPPDAPVPAAQASTMTTHAPNTGPHNAADVMFLQMLVTHHEQGLTMVRLAADRATRDEVRTLAAAIEVTQAAEVETMRSWLRGWGEATEADPAEHLHADHGGLPLTGEDLIGALDTVSGAEFEKRFLNLLIGHQHNAVEMARNQAKYGINPDARQLAERVDQSRTAQIQQMLTYLA